MHAIINGQRTLIVAVSVIFSGFSSIAQQITYSHDEVKLNQITVQETGIGSLTPPAFYETAHRKYASSANVENKTAFRTMAGTYSKKQIEQAEKFDSAMIKRAEIEGLNMVDRQVDIAWTAEQKKIERKLADFQRNINRIMLVGGNREQINLWQLEYNKLSTAIKCIRESYIPNSQRKKQYITIYRDICSANDKLLKLLEYQNNNKMIHKLLSAKYLKPDNRSSSALAAIARWRRSAWDAAMVKN